MIMITSVPQYIEFTLLIFCFNFFHQVMNLINSFFIASYKTKIAWCNIILCQYENIISTIQLDLIKKLNGK